MADPYLSNVVLLCHADGVNGSTTFTDVSLLAHTLTPTLATVSTAAPKFGTGAANFSANVASLIDAGTTSDYWFQNNPFTIESWVYFTSTANGVIMAQWKDTPGPNYYSWLFYMGAGNIHFSFNYNDGNFSSDNQDVTAAYTIPLNTWLHVAVDRDITDQIRIYVNGVVVVSTNITGKSIATSTTPCLIGNYGNLDVGFPGYLDEIRVTKGIARYAGAFTPPIAPFEAAISTNQSIVGIVGTTQFHAITTQVNVAVPSIQSIAQTPNIAAKSTISSLSAIGQFGTITIDHTIMIAGIGSLIRLGDISLDVRSHTMVDVPTLGIVCTATVANLIRRVILSGQSESTSAVGLVGLLIPQYDASTTIASTIATTQIDDLIPKSFIGIPTKITKRAFWSKVIYGNGIFVAFDNSIANSTAYSIDGIDWQVAVIPSPFNIHPLGIDVAYGNGMFVALSSIRRYYATSSDGITWVTQRFPRPYSDTIKSIAYGNGTFIVIDYSTDCLMSSGGISWLHFNTIPAGNWKSIQYSNGLFFLLADGVSNSCSTSPDGITWTSTVLPNADWTSITCGNNIFVAVSIGNKIATSTDGISWTSQTLPISANWKDVIIENRIFYVVSSAIVLMSWNCIDWFVQHPPIHLSSVAYGQETLVGVGYDTSYAMNYQIPCILLGVSGFGIANNLTFIGDSTILIGGIETIGKFGNVTTNNKRVIINGNRTIGQLATLSTTSVS